MSDLQLHTINRIQLDNKWNNQKFINIYLPYWKYRNKRQRYSQKNAYNVENQSIQSTFRIQIPICFRCLERSQNGLTTESERSQNEGIPGVKRD